LDCFFRFAYFFNKLLLYFILLSFGASICILDAMNLISPPGILSTYIPFIFLRQFTLSRFLNSSNNNSSAFLFFLFSAFFLIQRFLVRRSRMASISALKWSFSFLCLKIILLLLERNSAIAKSCSFYCVIVFCFFPVRKMRPFFGGGGVVLLVFS
jgi:hypothetical protein